MELAPLLDRLWLPTLLLVSALILFLAGEREAGLILIGGSGTAALPTKPVTQVKAIKKQAKVDEADDLLEAL